MFENHTRIGLDLDDTLLNGPASIFLANYVNDHPEKKFFLVTHRTPSELHTVPYELLDIGLNINQFEKLLSTSELMRIRFRLARQERDSLRLPSIYTGNVSEDEMTKEELNFVYWKGYVCKRMGITILVDDATPIVKPGTDRYNIKYINPYDIKPQ